MLAQELLAPSVFTARQARAYERLGNGLLILRSRWSPVHWARASFEQDASFYYFTGADHLLGAVLVLDGGKRRTELFLPSRVSGPVAALIASAQAPPTEAHPTSLHVDQVAEWSAFARYLDARLADDPHLTIWVDNGGFEPAIAGNVGTPLDSSATLDNPHELWRRAIQDRWPHATVASDTAIGIGLRAVKDSGEIAIMRRVAETSAAAFRAGLGRFAPGVHQRVVEAAVVGTCLQKGFGGPSFWPWIFSGRNSAFPRPFTSLLDLRHLDRVMQGGEIARYDIGCEIDHYMGDVGRTVPISGRFDPGQREVVDLLVAAYRAGLARLRDGVLVDDVIGASIAEVGRLRNAMRTSLGRRAAALIVERDSIPFWEIHGIGLDVGEAVPGILRAGMVVDYEPIFAVGDQGFYMEDMILIGQNGYEILTKGLPYTAAEIEQAMLRR
jgi:Xaa-Pro aminopeptidase